MDQDHYVPEVHDSAGGRRLFCVDFYTHGTNENGVNDRSKKSEYLAHNSQNYQNHKSLELGIVVKRVVLVFVVLFLLCYCCSPIVQQGCYPFAHSFVVKL